MNKIIFKLLLGAAFCTLFSSTSFAANIYPGHFSTGPVNVYIAEEITISDSNYFGLVTVDNKAKIGSLFRIELRGKQQLWIPLIVKTVVGRHKRVITSLVAMPESYGVAFVGKQKSDNSLELNPTKYGKKMGCNELYRLKRDSGQWLDFASLRNQYFSELQTANVNPSEGYVEVSLTEGTSQNKNIRQATDQYYGLESAVGPVGTIRSLSEIDQNGLPQTRMMTQISFLSALVRDGSRESLLWLQAPANNGIACYWKIFEFADSRATKQQSWKQKNKFGSNQ